jgi:hypothetical protein
LVTAFLETSFVTGLLVPAGAALSFATAFALGQGSSLPALATAALASGTVGDADWIGTLVCSLHDDGGCGGGGMALGGSDVRARWCYGVDSGGGRCWIRGTPPVHPVASAEEMRW